MKRGRFITLEGGEGAGKSTQAHFIKAWLEAQGREVVLTREPGGSPLAEAIRKIVLEQWQEGMSQEAEVLLMFAARAAHLRATIAPALAHGKDVVCDRFVDSSYAYQGEGSGFPAEYLQQLERMVLKGFSPDLTLVFDLDVRQGLERARKRGDENRFEAATLEYLERVRVAFLARAKLQPERYAVVDAGANQQQVQSRILTILESRL